MLLHGSHKKDCEPSVLSHEEKTDFSKFLTEKYRTTLSYLSFAKIPNNIHLHTWPGNVQNSIIFPEKGARLNFTIMGESVIIIHFPSFDF